MAGIFDAETRMTKKMTLNYTEGKINKSCVISNGSKNFHGHEFHFSEVTSIPKDAKFAYDLKIGKGIKKGKDGVLLYNTLASYGHLYFDSSNFAKQFIFSSIKFSRR